jgi:hypothetical protein
MVAAEYLPADWHLVMSASFVPDCLVLDLVSRPAATSRTGWCSVVGHEVGFVGQAMALHQLRRPSGEFDAHCSQSE